MNPPPEIAPCMKTGPSGSGEGVLRLPVTPRPACCPRPLGQPCLGLAGLLSTPGAGAPPPLGGTWVVRGHRHRPGVARGRVRPRPWAGRPAPSGQKNSGPGPPSPGSVTIFQARDPWFPGFAFMTKPRGTSGRRPESSPSSGPRAWRRSCPVVSSGPQRQRLFLFPRPRRGPYVERGGPERPAGPPGL